MQKYLILIYLLLTGCVNSTVNTITHQNVNTKSSFGKTSYTTTQNQDTIKNDIKSRYCKYDTECVIKICNDNSGNKLYQLSLPNDDFNDVAIVLIFDKTGKVMGSEERAQPIEPRFKKDHKINYQCS